MRVHHPRYSITRRVSICPRSWMVVGRGGGVASGCPGCGLMVLCFCSVVDGAPRQPGPHQSGAGVPLGGYATCWLPHEVDAASVGVRYCFKVLKNDWVVLFSYEMCFPFVDAFFMLNFVLKSISKDINIFFMIKYIFS